MNNTKETEEVFCLEVDEEEGDFDTDNEDSVAPVFKRKCDYCSTIIFAESKNILNH